MRSWLFLVVVLVGVVLAVLGSACGPQPAPPTPTPIPEPAVAFAKGAFPQTIPDRDWHAQAWLITDCLGCHGEGPLGEAPKVVHKDLPKLLLQVNCRTCHVAVSEAPTPTPKK